jgi:[ribosomal protein S5]-alanine N-acetyltransferase
MHINATALPAIMPAPHSYCDWFGESKAPLTSDARHMVHRLQKGSVFVSDANQVVLPVLETACLLLRPLRLEDAADQLAYASDRVVAELGMWDPLPTLEENRQDLVATLERQARGEAAELGIEHHADRRLIGRCGFVRFRRAHRSAEVGYALAQPYWGHGYMSEALAAVLTFGFRDLALHRIEATCLARNVGSIRVLEKAGFLLEGQARQAYWRADRCYDLRCYALLRPEWAASVPARRSNS